MNTYLKEFLHRGLIFGGFGPIIVGIIFAVIEKTTVGFSLGGSEILLAIISTYLLAFLQAGASVFNQIEHWPLPKSLFFHFATIYLAYTACYLANTWIPFEPMVILIFTAVFIVIYFIIWITVYKLVKGHSRKLNKKLL